MPDPRHPAIVLAADPPREDARDALLTNRMKIAIYRPLYALIVPLLDHAGSRREDGWRIRVDLSDGRTGYLTFSRRKLWRSESEIDLGTCDGVHASLEIDGEAQDA